MIEHLPPTSLVVLVVYYVYHYFLSGLSLSPSQGGLGGSGLIHSWEMGNDIARFEAASCCLDYSLGCC